jgi:hypothetical protein
MRFSRKENEVWITAGNNKIGGMLNFDGIYPSSEKRNSGMQ